MREKVHSLLSFLLGFLFNKDRSGKRFLKNAQNSKRFYFRQLPLISGSGTFLVSHRVLYFIHSYDALRCIDCILELLIYTILLLVTFTYIRK